MAFGTRTPLRGAEHEILRALRLQGPLTRAELVGHTGLSRATISSASRRLQSVGRIDVVGLGLRHRQIGRIPERLALNVTGAVLLGVEFGHRRVTVTAMNEAHDVEGTASREYAQESDWASRATIAFQLMESLRILGERTVIAVGLGIPGRIPNRAKVTEQLVSLFAAKVAPEVRADNNARLAGLAESVWGAAQDLDSFVYLRLMDGVGGALITRSGIYDGRTGTAGEFGHMTVDPGGPACRCGRRGCLEAYVSRERILAATAHRSLADLKEVLDAGDSRRRDIVAGAGHRIGTVLANVCTALDVDGVVLGGDLTALGTHLTGPLRVAFHEHLMPGRAEGITIHPARISHVDGALGGIALVLRDDAIPLRHTHPPRSTNIGENG